MKEIWKDIVGYEGLYRVSNLGNVYSCYANRLLSQGTHKDGYKFVILRKDNKDKYMLVHRLVAIAFIENPNNLPVVNHKDETPSNNNVSNLEWCTYLYNATYNDVHIKKGVQLSRTIYAYDDTGKQVFEFYSSHEAERQLGISNSNINMCCNNKSLTYKNMVWSYEKLSKQDVLNKFEKSRNSDNLAYIHKKNNMLSKSVNQYDLDGNLINTYPSTREAGRQLGFSSSLVAGVCRGEHKQTHGFVFKYAS